MSGLFRQGKFNRTRQPILHGQVDTGKMRRFKIEQLPRSYRRGTPTVQLMGERITSPSQARNAFEKGHFIFQFGGEGYNDPSLEYCTSGYDLEMMCRRLGGKTHATIRPL